MSFFEYCKALTDDQLENVLDKEFEASLTNPSRKEDFEVARTYAEGKGWSVMASGNTLLVSRG